VDDEDGESGHFASDRDEINDSVVMGGPSADATGAAPHARAKAAFDAETLLTLPTFASVYTALLRTAFCGTAEAKGPSIPTTPRGRLIVTACDTSQSTCTLDIVCALQVRP